MQSTPSPTNCGKLQLPPARWLWSRGREGGLCDPMEFLASEPQYLHLQNEAVFRAVRQGEVRVCLACPHWQLTVPSDARVCYQVPFVSCVPGTELRTCQSKQSSPIVFYSQCMSVSVVTCVALHKPGSQRTFGFFLHLLCVLGLNSVHKTCVASPFT